MRPWLLLKYINIPFKEVRIPLYTPESSAELAKYSPSGLVPVLQDGDLTVWDSLAIGEYLAEKFPDCNLWPDQLQTKAIARSVSAEMHSGFTALRHEMPMNCRAQFQDWKTSTQAQKDIQRISTIWTDCRNRFGADGDMLFGKFSIADAMFAPVAIRFFIYNIELDSVSRAYMRSLLSFPPVQEWITAGKQEAEKIDIFEN